MKAKRNQRAWDANDEPRKIDKLPPTPRKKFKRLSREIMDRAASHRANGAAVPFYELEEWASQVRDLEKAVDQFARHAWATVCFPKGGPAEMVVKAAMVLRKHRTIDEVCNKPPGWFQQELKAATKALRRADARRAKRIKRAIKEKAKR